MDELSPVKVQLFFEELKVEIEEGETPGRTLCRPAGEKRKNSLFFPVEK
jgi:hypothetical protein